MKMALITPAYGPDRPLLELACAQVDRFCPGIEHVIVVGRKEAAIFRHLQSANRKILFKEDVLPGLFGRTYLRFRRREAFLHGAFRPVGGWIVQQIVKLTAPQLTDADVFLFLDSDVFLIRPFPFAKFVSDGRVRLLRRAGGAVTDDQKDWHRSAARLLGIADEETGAADYVGPLISWRRDICLQLQKRLEEKWHGPMAQTLMREQRLSEYTLFGLFADQLLPKPDEKHLRTGEELCLSTWSFDREGDMAASLCQALRPQHCAVNLQSNLRWPFERYARTLAAVTAHVGAQPDENT